MWASVVVGKEGFSGVTNSKIYNRTGKSSFLIEAIGFGDVDNNYRISMTSSIFFFFY